MLEAVYQGAFAVEMTRMTSSLEYKRLVLSQKKICANPVNLRLMNFPHDPILLTNIGHRILVADLEISGRLELFQHANGVGVRGVLPEMRFQVA